MKTYLILAAVLLSVAIAAGGTPVIDFEDNYPGFEKSYGYLGNYDGFQWSSYSKWITSQHLPGTGYENGTTGRVSLYNTGEEDISFSGDLFDFEGAYITSAWRIDQDFTVEGWRDGNLIYSSTQKTSYDGPYWFDFDFNDIDTVWFRPSFTGTNAGLGYFGNQLVIDNITVTPEPCSLLFMAIGGLALKMKPRQYCKKKIEIQVL